ncbi:MAG: hypothetical protein ACRCYE_11180 [Sarcina sp.]
MGCFSLGVVCNNLDEVNDLVYPFHNEFIGYYPKEYYDRNPEEKKYLKFNSFSRDIEKEWGELTLIEKQKFNENIERFADVKYGYYYNEERSDIGYYENTNGKMICFEIGGRFIGAIKTKGKFGRSKPVSYAKVEDIIIPSRKEKFGTYALVHDGKWISVDDFENRDEWFYINYKRIIKKLPKEKMLVIVECLYK